MGDADDIGVGDLVILKKIPDWLIHDSSEEDVIRMNGYVGKQSIIVDIDDYGYYWLEFGNMTLAADEAIYVGDTFCVTRDCIVRP